MPADDLWVVTCYFNSSNFITKYENYLLFIASLERSAINYLVIECAFDDQSFSLPESPNVMKVRSDSIVWQKERLLNMAVAVLPDACKKVAWIDCDVFFENEAWATETSALLDHHAVVQPFEYVVRLPRNEDHYAGRGECYESFAAVYQKNSNKVPQGDFNRHGHTGFAWAMRRDVLQKHGLYDPCPSGSSDHLMVHAFCDDLDSFCMPQLFGDNDIAVQHFRQWAKAVYPEVCGQVVYVPGILLHSWHGDVINRQYLKRNLELAAFKFNPFNDLQLNAAGCWEWAELNPSRAGLIQWSRDFYDSRKEDG